MEWAIVVLIVAFAVRSPIVQMMVMHFIYKTFIRPPNYNFEEEE